MRWTLLLLAMFPLARAGEDALLRREVEAISDAHPEILFMAVVYNERTHGAMTLPTHGGHIRLISVPVSSPRDFYGAITQGLLRTSTVQAIFLVDDGGKLVTRLNTLKFLNKQAVKFQFLLFSDQTEPSEYLSGRVVLKNENVVLVE